MFRPPSVLSAEPVGGADAPARPLPPARPEPGAGLGRQILSLVRYLTQSEVHTYAFSVAANAILTFFPLVVLLYTLAHRVFHSTAMANGIGEVMRFFLPTVSASAGDFVVRNMATAASSHGIRIVSLVMLVISSTGVFLPLEVALNQVWGVGKSRSYLGNQVVSLGLALLMTLLAVGVVALDAVQHWLLTIVFFGHTTNIVFRLLNSSMIEIALTAGGIAMFVVIYWVLPNRRIPLQAVLPTAVVMGLVWEASKFVYILVLPRLDLEASYGPFYISVGLIFWGYVTGLVMLAGAHHSATRYTLRLAYEADVEADARVGRTAKAPAG